MKRFKEYIKEYYIVEDPFKKLSKLDKKRGIDSTDQEEIKRSDGEIDAVDVKTRNIPLQNSLQDDDTLDDLTHKYVAHQQSNKPTSNNVFKIKDLIPTQSHVRIDDMHRFRNKITGSDPISVATHEGKHYIMDGHHATFAARLRGETHIQAQHYNLDQ